MFLITRVYFIKNVYFIVNRLNKFYQRFYYMGNTCKSAPKPTEISSKCNSYEKCEQNQLLEYENGFRDKEAKKYVQVTDELLRRSQDSSDPSQVLDNMTLLALYFNRGNAFQQLMRQEPSSKEEHFSMASQSFQQAMRCCEKLPNSLESLIRVQFNLGTLNFGEKKYVDADRYFEQILKNQTFLQNLQFGEQQELHKEQFNRSIINAFHCLVEQEKYQEAHELISSLRQQIDQYMQPGDAKQLLQFQSNIWQSVESYIKKSTDCSNQYAQTKSEQCLNEGLKHLESAEKLLIQFPEQLNQEQTKKYRVSILQKKGRLLCKQKKFEVARGCFDQIIGNLDAANPSAYINRGISYYHQGNYDKAIQDYQEALKLTQNAALQGDCYYHIALAQTKQGMYFQAETNYLQAITLDKNSQYYMHLGMLYQNHFLNLDKCKQQLELIVQPDPKDQGLVQNLKKNIQQKIWQAEQNRLAVKSLFQLGKYQEILNINDDTNIELFTYKAASYLILNQIDNAVELADQVITQEQKNQVQQEASEKARDLYYGFLQQKQTLQQSTLLTSQFDAGRK